MARKARKRQEASSPIRDLLRILWKIVKWTIFLVVIALICLFIVCMTTNSFDSIGR